MEKKLMTFESKALSHITVPVLCATGSSPGPTLTLLAGVHGCEYTSQKAVRIFMGSLDESKLAGRVVAIPTLNYDSFFERSPFVSPADGLNLNRSFPGKVDGSYSEALAYEVTERFIAPSNFVVDLHAGDMVEDLEPFMLHEASEVQETSEAMARAYGFTHCVLQPASGKTVSGASTSAAASLGIPAIIAESGGRGLLEEHAVAGHVDGLRRLALSLEMYKVPGLTLEDRPFKQYFGFDWLRCVHRGWWEPAVSVGDSVRRSQVLGVILNLLGEPQEEIRATNDGTVLFLTSSPAVKDDGLLVGIATP